MKKLMIIGAGGHAKSILDAVLSEKKYDKIGVLVDDEEGAFYGYPILGPIRMAEKFVTEYENVVIGIGNTPFRMKLQTELKKMGFLLPNIIHATAYVSPFASLEEGTVVLGGAFINAGTTIGRGCIINTKVSVDHDCKIADGVHISPGSVLSGTVTVGENTWICAGCTIGNHLTIGKESIIGAGSVIRKEVPSYVVIAGNPPKILRKLEKY